jgi:hypothetical protein
MTRSVSSLGKNYDYEGNPFFSASYTNMDLDLLLGEGLWWYFFFLKESGHSCSLPGTGGAVTLPTI